MVESHAFIFADTRVVPVHLRAVREFAGTWSAFGMHHWHWVDVWGWLSLEADTCDQEHRVQPAYISVNIKSSKNF